MENNHNVAVLPQPPFPAEAAIGDFEPQRMVLFVETIKPEVCEPRFRQRPTGKVSRGKCWIDQHGRLVRR